MTLTAVTHMDQFKSTTNFIVSTILRTKLFMHLIIQRWFVYVCLMWDFPESVLMKIETFWSLSGLYVKVCVYMCVVIFVHLWVQSVKSHYHALLQTEITKEVSLSFVIILKDKKTLELHIYIYIYIYPGDRIPVEARISAPVQTGPVVHPASYTMCTGSFSGVKRPGRGVDHPHLAPRLKKE